MDITYITSQSELPNDKLASRRVENYDDAKRYMDFYGIKKVWYLADKKNCGGTIWFTREDTPIVRPWRW